MANPDFKLREVRVLFYLITLPAFPPSVISSFLPKIREQGWRGRGQAPRASPLDLPLSRNKGWPVNRASTAFCFPFSKCSCNS